MNVQEFESLDDTTIYTSIIKGVVTKIYHIEGVRLNNSHQLITFRFEENSNNHQIGFA